MVARIDKRVDRRRIAATVVPVVIVSLAGVAVRTPLASAYPLAALLLFLWIVADTLMLALVARSSGRPERSAVLGALAGASVTVWLGSPAAIRSALRETPIVALMMGAAVLGHVAWATVRARRALTGRGEDRRSEWVSAASAFLPPALVRLAVAELTVIHMAVFRWGGPADVPANARAFAYHRHLTPMCVTLLILSGIEMTVYHLLLGHWSRTAAIAMFILSDVGFVYLLGLIKSFRFRPVLLMPDGIRVRAGFLIDEFIPIDAISTIDGDFGGDEVRDPATLNAALLAWPNVLVRLNRPLHRRSLLGKRTPAVRVAFRLDDPASFTRLLLWRLGQRS